MVDLLCVEIYCKRPKCTHVPNFGHSTPPGWHKRYVHPENWNQEIKINKLIEINKLKSTNWNQQIKPNGNLKIPGNMDNKRYVHPENWNQQIKPNGNLKIPGNMDSELYFRDHISDICKTASQKVGVLMRLRNVIPRRPTPFISICSTFAFDVPSDSMALL